MQNSAGAFFASQDSFSSYRTSKRLQIKHDCEVEIKFCISDEQYMRIAA